MASSTKCLQQGTHQHHGPRTALVAPCPWARASHDGNVHALLLHIKRSLRYSDKANASLRVERHLSTTQHEQAHTPQRAHKTPRSHIPPPASQPPLPPLDHRTSARKLHSAAPQADSPASSLPLPPLPAAAAPPPHPAPPQPPPHLGSAYTGGGVMNRCGNCVLAARSCKYRRRAGYGDVTGAGYAATTARSASWCTRGLHSR